MAKKSKIKSILKYIAFLVICFVAFECVNRAVFYFRYTSPEKMRESKLDLSVYKNTDWADEYYQELRTLGGYTYESYLGWKGKAFQGKFINVSSDGTRKTWNPQNLDKTKAKLVYVFGGSVLWGMGARDDYTISSFVSKMLNKDDEQYYVMNHGQNGYSLFQEMIALLLLIKDNQVPDYVLFFDGINDIHSAFVNNRAGDAADFSQKREQLKYENEIKSNRDYLIKFVKGYIDARITVYTFTRKLRQKWRKWQEWNELDSEGKEKAETMTIEDRDDQQLLSLANDVVNHYFGTADIVRGLATVYGFKVAFFWQPITWANVSLSEEEAEFVPKGGTRLKLNRLVYAIVEEKKNQKDFYDLQKIFQSKDKNMTAFIDFCHLSEFGNSIVAKNMVSALKSEIIN